MTREEAIYELGEWLEQMIQHGVPSHSAKRKALATAIALLSDDAVQGEWTYLSGSKGSYMTISCPICGSTFNDVAEWEYHYCPSCGAKMKGGDDE